MGATGPAGLGVAHSGIQSKKEPSVYSTIGFRDLDNIQLEFAIDAPTGRP